jgi:hypothetical protein
LPATSLFANFVGTVALLLAPWAVLKAEPRMLTPSQLDGVTAGRVHVDASTLVNAVGDYTRAITNAQAAVVGGQGLGTTFGLGLDEGVACCGSEPKLHVHTEISGSGDRVMGGTVSFFTHTGDMTLAFALGWILAISSASQGENSQAAIQGLPIFGRLAPMWRM